MGIKYVIQLYTPYVSYYECLVHKVYILWGIYQKMHISNIEARFV